MQTTLRLIAGALIVLMGGWWLWGFDVLDEAAVRTTVVVLPLGATALCALAWWVRSRRRRVCGWETTIDGRLLWRRALGVVVLMAICFAFALLLDRIGDRPHPTFAWGALNAAWVAVGIASLLFCGVCVIGGSKR